MTGSASHASDALALTAVSLAVFTKLYKGVGVQRR